MLQAYGTEAGSVSGAEMRYVSEGEPGSAHLEEAGAVAKNG